jgi:hypothetical protein
MPCNDVTEYLEILIDPDDRVMDYSLSKVTCGGTIGYLENVKRWVLGRSAEQVLRVDPMDYLDNFRFKSMTLEFLHLKHLFALQTGLAMLGGKKMDLPVGLCVIDGVEHGPEGTRVQARIRIDLITEKIKACGKCDNCATHES